VLIGPWVGEIGYELEYWIPFMRRQLRLHGIAPEQTTVLTRGGAGLWYRDFVAHELDALELVRADRFLPLLDERRRLAGDAKQLRVESLDRQLVALARERLGAVIVIHPSLMFARLRGLWFRDTPLGEVLRQLEFRPLCVAAEPPPGLPRDYVAVKLYFNECLPESRRSDELLRRAVERLAGVTDVVLLSTGLLVDDHREWTTRLDRVYPVEHLLRPEDNLAVQTRIIAGARGFLATYGGFSYLGPLLQVPTLTLYEVEQTVPVHLALLREAFPDAAYDRRVLGDAQALERFVAAVAPASVDG
jgi:hypothetical protein